MSNSFNDDSEELYNDLGTEEDSLQLTQQAQEINSNSGLTSSSVSSFMSPVMVRQRQRVKLVHVELGVIQFGDDDGSSSIHGMKLSIGRSKQADVTIKPLSDADDPGTFL